MAPSGLYDSEHRTVFIVRLIVHLAGCIMIFTGPANHPFLSSNRRLLVVSLVLVLACMIMEEANIVWPSTELHYAKLITFKVAEACIATLVLLGCVLLRSITFRETYRLNNVFYLALGLQFVALATDNNIKLGYLGNSAVSGVALLVLWEFLSVFQAQGTEAQNVKALMHLQALLTILSLATFVGSLYHSVFGLKLAQYVLQIFAITLFYLFVRPYVQPNDRKEDEDIKQLEINPT